VVQPRYALHYSREHARAVDAFEHARQLGYSKPTSIYNIACAYAMLDQRELAFEWLDRAVDGGFDLHGSINGDRDLDNLRSDPRFERFSRQPGTSARMRRLINSRLAKAPAPFGPTSFR